MWREFAGLVDDVVYASMPHPFLAVGESYWEFGEVSDEEVSETARHTNHLGPWRGGGGGEPGRSGARADLRVPI